MESRPDFIGSVSVRLFVSTSAVDTDFTAKLVDVYPNGKALIVNDGILRGRYREGEKATMLTPGEVYEWNIDLGYTALKINPGHRIRLEISSSNFPRYNRNLNTGENIATATRTVVAHQKVFHSEQYPSRLILNVLSE
jgi:putative CocE/NonD family hydrolase